MKKLIIAMVAAGLLGVDAFAGDPGGSPGLAKAIFKGSVFDMTSDVSSHAIGYQLVPDEMYVSSLEEKTTIAWEGYMHMVAGTTYNFKGRYDDFVTVKIAGNWVLSKGSECQERSGSYTPTATDWYKIEFRVANNGGGGGCTDSSYYGILWKTASEEAWHQVSDDGSGALFKTGIVGLKCLQKAVPIIVSSQIRANDSTILDVVYKVVSANPTVNVRALAFEDGERSFWKVVRPETFVKDADGNETAQNIGDGIAANVEHKLSWKVSADWKTDLAKVKFEVLTSEMGQLPMKKITIPATAKNPAMTVAYNTQTDTDIFNALLWYYADGVDDLINKDGYVDATYGYANQVDTTPHRFVNRTTLNNRMEPLRYVLNKMGWEPLEGGNLLNYVRKSTRKDLWYNSGTQNAAILKSTKPKNLYLGEKAYCVIDVSSGANAEKYPVSYLDAEPVEGWADEPFKTTQIVLRRIPAGAFTMGLTRWPNWAVNDWKPVTLTRSFWMGVYTITQKQYELVMGDSAQASVPCKGNTRPAIVSWSALRGASDKYDWPAVTAVDSQSFIGKLRAKTGLELDLPTMAQWQYACCAGTSSYYNNGGSNEVDLKLVGRAWTENTLPVGSYIANCLGLYDMHGNVGQWCLEHAEPQNSDPEVDPVGSSDGGNRMFCGLSPRDGYWHPCSSAFYTMSASNPDANSYRYTSSIYLGFRLSGFVNE